jgi:hypothetical protein
MISSSVSASITSVSASGRAAPGGGIMPARSFRIIRSATVARVAASSTSKSSRERSPRSRLSLWQRAQYSSITSVKAVVDKGRA